MSSVDDRIVNMEFNNSQFQKGVSDTSKSLEDLNTKLKLPTGTKGLSDIDSAAKKLSLQGVADGVQAIAGKFSALSVIGVTALATIASKAVDAGIQVVKSLTIDPVKAGLDSYTEQINATQTILANTAASGATLGSVTDVLKTLQTYAQQTVYSFSDMTTNIGRFTAAGVGLQDATDAIKGMSNFAALTGASTQQLSGAMYQVSQALATGVIRLQDWNSLSNANLGTKSMQTALEETARTLGDHGKAMDAAIKKNGNFRESLQAGWLTSDVFNKAMKVMGGTIDQATGKFRPFTKEEIKAMGYTDEAASSLAELSTQALNSAIKIRTIPQLMDALGEEVAGAWSGVFKQIFGDLNQATSLFTGLHNVLENIFTSPINALEKYLEAWNKLGGRTKVIDGIVAAFKGWESVMGRVKNVFDQVFPNDGGKGLLAMTNGFVALLKALTPGPETAGKLALVFKGIFSLFDIGIQIVKGIATVFGDLFGATLKSSGGILDVAAKLGQWIFEVDQALKNGGKLQNFFKTLGSIIKVPIQILGNLITMLVTGFGSLKNIDYSGIQKGLGRVNDKLQEFRDAGARIQKIWGPIGDFFSAVWKKITPALDAIGNAFKNLGKGIASAVTSGSFQPVLDAINTGLFGAITLLVAKFFKKGLSFKFDFSGGLIGQIKETFETLTGSLKQMIDAKIKTQVIKQISVAVALLAASAVALSLVDSKRLAASMAAITIMVSELAAIMALLGKLNPSKSAARLPILAATLVILAAAVDELTVSVVALSHLSWAQLAKGMSALTIILDEIIALTKRMGPVKGLFSTALALTAVATAVNVLAGAVVIMSTMSWESIGRGMAGVAGGLAIMVAAMRFLPPEVELLASAAAIGIVASAVVAIAGAMKITATMSWNQIGKGLTVMAVGLAAIGAVLTGLAFVSDATAVVGLVAGAAAIALVANAMIPLSAAMKIMGGMSWSAIGKSMVVLAGSLLILAVGMIAMIPALPGAVALTVIAAALAVFVPILLLLGKMSWSTIGTGLGALAAALGVLAVAGVAILPAVPGLVGLGVAIGLIGAGAALAGVGMIGIAAGLTAIGAAGPLAIGGIKQLVIGIINLIPQAAAAMATGILTFLTTIAGSVGQMVKAMSTLLGGIITAINQNQPKIIAMLASLLSNLISRLSKDIPKWADQGIKMLLSLLNGLSKNMGQLTTAGGNVIVRFINGVSSNLGRITTAGTNLLINFINGISSNMTRLADAGEKAVINFVNGVANSIRSNQGAMNAAGANLAFAIADGMTGGLASRIGGIASKAADMAKSALNAAKNVLGIHSPSKEFYEVGDFSGQGFGNALDDAVKPVSKSAENMGTGAVDALRKSMMSLSKKVDTDINLSPTITPVMDLTDIKNKTGQISSLVASASNTPISVSAQYQAAAAIAAQRNNAQQVETDADGVPVSGTSLTFNQTINSPKAVPPAEVYRQTNNLISKAKGDLAKK